MTHHIRVLQGDIAKIEVDAIVNAANESLLGGGGVDGAIHQTAGSELLEECRTLGGCPTGQAKFTKGYNLPAKYIIHTVGPVWQGGNANEVELLASCYRSSLELAKQHGLKTIAFPSISTGAFGFPMERAAQIAVRVICEFLKSDSSIEEVTLVCFDLAALETHQRVLDERDSTA